MYTKVFPQTDVDQALNQCKWTLPLSVLLWYPHEGAFRYYFFASRLAHFVIPFWFASRTFAIELLWHHLRICRTSFSKINVVENNGYSVYPQPYIRQIRNCVSAKSFSLRMSGLKCWAHLLQQCTYPTSLHRFSRIRSVPPEFSYF